jgi:hypothetical protein
VINVFASWYPPCRQELPGIVAPAHAHHGAVAFLGVDEQEPVEIGTRLAAALKILYRSVSMRVNSRLPTEQARCRKRSPFGPTARYVRSVTGAISRAELERRIAAL